MGTYTNLIVWQKAMDLSDRIDTLCRNFPKEEQHCLISQIKRCALSVALNIAEGKGYSSVKQTEHFFFIARGSLNETGAAIHKCLRMKYISKEEFVSLTALVNEIYRMLTALIKSESRPKS